MNWCVYGRDVVPCAVNPSGLTEKVQTGRVGRRTEEDDAVAHRTGSCVGWGMKLE